jgi:hypothetical protein
MCNEAGRLMGKKVLAGDGPARTPGRPTREAWSVEGKQFQSATGCAELLDLVESCGEIGEPVFEMVEEDLRARRAVPVASE